MTNYERIDILRNEVLEIDESVDTLSKEIYPIRKKIRQRLCNILFKEYLPRTEWIPIFSNKFKPYFDAVNSKHFKPFIQLWTGFEHDSLIMGKISFIVNDGDVTLRFDSIDYGLRIARLLRLEIDCTDFEERIVQLRNEASSLEGYLRRISDGLSRRKSQDS